jgi:hypothetical protein
MLAPDPGVLPEAEVFSPAGRCHPDEARPTRAVMDVRAVVIVLR